MELLALALVNVATAGLMYVFFSMRFSRAVRQTVEQSRKNSLIRELKENVELTIEYINSSLDTMDQKTRSFYQLLRRSEELAAQLEALDERQSARIAAEDAGARPARKSGVRKSSGTGAKKKAGTARATSGAASKGGKKTAVKKSKSAAADQPPPQSELLDPVADPLSDMATNVTDDLERDYDVDRVLQDVGDDRLEISATPRDLESAYRDGERSRHFVAPQSTGTATTGTGDQAGGVFGRIGAITRRILGIDALPNAGLSEATSGPVNEAGTAAAQPRSRARFEVPQLSSEELARPVPGAPPRVGMAAETGGGHAGPQAGEQGDAVLPRLDRLELSAAPAPPSDESAGYRMNGRVPGAGYGPVFSAQPELPPPMEVLEAQGLTSAVHEGEARRAEVIRALLQYGYRPGDISRATGIGLPEVELVASLPASGRRRRRQRLSGAERGAGAE